MVVKEAPTLVIAAGGVLNINADELASIRSERGRELNPDRELEEESGSGEDECERWVPAFFCLLGWATRTWATCVSGLVA